MGCPFYPLISLDDMIIIKSNLLFAYVNAPNISRIFILLSLTRKSEKLPKMSPKRELRSELSLLLTPRWLSLAPPCWQTTWRRARWEDTQTVWRQSLFSATKNWLATLHARSGPDTTDGLSELVHWLLDIPFVGNLDQELPMIIRCKVLS